MMGDIAKWSVNPNPNPNRNPKALTLTLALTRTRTRTLTLTLTLTRSVLFIVMLLGYAGALRVLYSAPDAAHLLGMSSPPPATATAPPTPMPPPLPPPPPCRRRYRTPTVAPTTILPHSTLTPPTPTLHR